MALSFGENLSAKENLTLAGLFYEELECCVSRVKSYNNMVKNLAQKYNTFYLDIPNIIKPGKDNFRDICHFTEEGAMLMAQAVKNKLKEVGIIR